MAEDTASSTMPRVGRAKVRTGCIVCKIRHVKCDETKPSCLRCTSTGRKCDGYVDPPPIQRGTRSPQYAAASKSLSLHSLSLDASEDISERRSFQYFRSRTVQDISSCFESEFWDYLVLQVSRTEPAVRHALLALSSLYEISESSKKDQGGFSASEADTRFALQQYTKAVGLLANNQSTYQPSLQAILISCIIFVWIEFLQDNLDEALRHLRGGLQILKDPQEPSHLLRIDASLPRIFTRLHTQARLHGSPSSDFNSSTPDTPLDITPAIPPTFSNIDEARNCLDQELDSIFLFMRQMYHPSFVHSTMQHHPFPSPLSLESTVQSHLHALQAWQTASQHRPFLSSILPDTKQSAGYHLLQLHHTATTIMLSTSLSTSEMVFDDYTPAFERILSLAERLIHDTQENNGNSLPVLCLDIGVITPLFLVALKCRDLRMRRRAVELLKVSPEREGIWHRARVVEFAEWKIGREEEGRGTLPEGETLPEDARTYGERSREAVVDGKDVRIVRFKRGARCDIYGPADGYVEEITGLSIAMGECI